MTDTRLLLAALAASIIALAGLAWSHWTTGAKIDQLLERLEELDGKIQKSSVTVCNYSVAPVHYSLAIRKSERRLRVTPRYPLGPGECDPTEFFHHTGYGQPYVFGYARVNHDWIWTNRQVNAFNGTAVPAENRLEKNLGDHVLYEGTADAILCINANTSKTYDREPVSDDTCPENSDPFGYALAGHSQSSPRQWGHVFEQPNWALSEGDPERPLRGMATAQSRARAMSEAALRQRLAQTILESKPAIAYLGATLSDTNSPLNPGVEIENAMPEDIFGSPQLIKAGDIITSINGQPVFGLSDIFYELQQHASDVERGINKPVQITLIRDECPNSCTLNAIYFFNLRYVEQSDGAEVLWWGATNGWLFGQGPLASCTAEEVAKVGGNIIAGAINGIDAWFNDKPFDPSSLETFTNRTSDEYKQCVWTREQRAAVSRQTDKDYYNAAEIAGIIGPGGLRMLFGKGLQRQAAKSLGKGAAVRGFASAALETMESALWCLSAAAPGTSYPDRIKAATAAIPFAAGIGFATGTLFESKLPKTRTKHVLLRRTRS